MLHGPLPEYTVCHETKLLASLLELDLLRHMLHGPLPEYTVCHETKLLATSRQLHRGKHCFASLLIDGIRSQSECTRNHSRTSEKLVELIVRDTAFRFRIRLDEAVQDEVVEGCMLVRSRV